MKKKMKRLFAFLLASVMMFSTLTLTAAAEEEEYLMFLAYGGEYTENAWDMCWANEADNTSGIEATTAMAKVGDTVTIGLKMPQEVFHTWYMAPVLVAEGVTDMSYTIDSVTIDGEEVLDTLDLTVGDSEWWYEGTGTYTAEQSIRLKGGYNEWAAQAMSASPTGFTEIMYTITLTGLTKSAPAASSTPTDMLMFVAYGGEYTEGAWDMCWANEAENASGIVATTATANVGDTVTIGLTMPQEVFYTWYMAPVVIAEGITDFSYTIDSITIDGEEVLDTVDLTVGDDEWWYEGTGEYTADQSIRLKGGYNEWAAQAFSASPTGFTEIMYTITITGATAGSGAAAGAPTPSTESYQAFIALGGDKEADNDWAYGYYGEDVEGITAVNGELKNGETTTLSLTFDSPVFYTWFVAPCFVVDDSSVISEESTFDVKVYLDGVEQTIDMAAGKACWAEGTGNYAAENCMRIAGGYNEWGDKYMAESPKGFTEIKFEITPNILVAAPAAEAAPQNEFDPNGTYHAYIGVQTPTYSFRNSWDDATYGIETDYFYQITGWDAENNAISLGGTFTDAEITGNGTYTVKVEGFDDWSGDFASADVFNLIFVSTDLPVNDEVVISNVVLKMDGKEIATMDSAFLDPDSKEVQKVLLANIWNTEIEALPYYAIPTQSIEISFDVSGFANDAVVAEPEATEAPATEAPAEATEAPATEAPAADTSADAEEGGSSVGIIIAVVVVVAVVAVGAGVVVAKKKKETK